MILAIFFVWMVFFDENSWVNHREFDKEIDKLKSEKEYYQSQIDSDKAFINKHNDKEELEKLINDLIDGKNLPFNEAKSEGNKVISDAKNKAENLLSDVNKLIEQINREAN